MLPPRLSLNLAALALCLWILPTTEATPPASDRREQHAYWTCPDSPAGTLADVYETGWRRVLDELRDRGVLSDFGAGRPLGAMLATGPALHASQTRALTYDWFIWYQSPSADRLTSFWQTFDDTAARLDPDMPRPSDLCDAVLLVDYAF
jgi:hypothetical protein